MRRLRRVLISLLFAITGVTAIHTTPASAAAPAAPFTQCPAIGNNTSCALLIVINPDGSAAAYEDTSQGPYDGIEDTLIGIQNNSAFTINSLPLSGPNIFGFDGDGICSGFYNGTPAGCPFGPTGYEGPDTSFTIVDGNSGSVNFLNGGLKAGKSNYFSLEEIVTPGNIVLPAATKLVADAAIVQVGPGAAVTFPNLIAHLSSAKKPVAGERIDFQTADGKQFICSGVTDNTGTAKCAGSLAAAVSLQLGYNAVFAGDNTRTPPLLPSSAHGTLVTAGKVRIR